MALASDAYASKAWVKFEDLAALQHPAVKFVHGSVDAVDPETLTAQVKTHGSPQSSEVKYDYLVAASGLRRPWPVVPQSLTRSEYLKEAQSNIDACENAEHGVVVIGGGAVGVEMAAELKLVQPQTKVTLIHSRDKLLSAEPLPDDFKDAVAPLVRDAAVDLILGARVTATDRSPSDANTQILTLSNNTTLKASHVISAISQPIPTTSYLPATALDAEGYVKIAPTLHFASDTTAHHARRHFAVGDIAAWSGIKRCGAAMHMGHYAAFNIHQQLLSSSRTSPAKALDVAKPAFMSLAEHPPVIGLAVGRTAVTYGPADGVKSGADVEKIMFGGDLGWSICWNYLRLGERNPPPASAPVEELAELELREMDEKVVVEVAVKEGARVVASAA